MSILNSQLHADHWDKYRLDNCNDGREDAIAKEAAVSEAAQVRLIVTVLACLCVAAAQKRTADALFAFMFLTHVLSTAVVNAAPESCITLLAGEDFA